MTETVNHPKHYQHPSGVECWEISILLPHALASAFEYVWRHEQKNGVEDLRKAKWWLEHYKNGPELNLNGPVPESVRCFLMHCSECRQTTVFYHILMGNEAAAIFVIDQMISELIA